MNLYECRIAYTLVPPQLLKLSSRIAVLTALDHYRGLYAAKTPDSPYRKRKFRETQRELLDKSILAEDSNGEFELNPILTADQVSIPTDLDYAALKLCSIKTLVAAYSRSRYSREAFRFTCRQEELAASAHLSERKLRDALSQLEEKRFISVSKKWRQGSQFTLLDPACGTPLYEIGMFYREHMDRIPHTDRYKLILKHCDPRGHLETLNGYVRGYMTVCPYCKYPKATLRFSATETEDYWKCFRCNRGGDSARLFAAFLWKLDKPDFKATFASIEAVINGRTSNVERRLQ